MQRDLLGHRRLNREPRPDGHGSNFCVETYVRNLNGLSSTDLIFVIFHRNGNLRSSVFGVETYTGCYRLTQKLPFLATGSFSSLSGSHRHFSPQRKLCNDGTN